jgi:hypothetical protein
MEELPLGAPVNRVVLPRDVIEIKTTDESIYIVGTRGQKVTKIWGLNGMANLKVTS